MNINEAEAKISEILRQLEIDSGCVVESIGCSSIEVTTYGDDRPRFQMKVEIELQRQPGRNW